MGRFLSMESWVCILNFSPDLRSSCGKIPQKTVEHWIQLPRVGEAMVLATRLAKTGSISLSSLNRDWFCTVGKRFNLAVIFIVLWPAAYFQNSGLHLYNNHHHHHHCWQKHNQHNIIIFIGSRYMRKRWKTCLQQNPRCMPCTLERHKRGVLVLALFFYTVPTCDVQHI